MRLVRRTDHPEGDGTTPEMVFVVLSAASMGAVPGGRVGPVRCPDRRAARGDPHAHRAQAPGLPACSVTSPDKSRTAGSTTATCSPWPAPSMSCTRCSVAESALATASPHGRHGSVARGDVPGDRGDRARCRRHPPQHPNQATGRRSEPGENFELLHLDCHQAAEIGAFSPMDVPCRASASGRRRGVRRSDDHSRPVPRCRRRRVTASHP